MVNNKKKMHKKSVGNTANTANTIPTNRAGTQKNTPAMPTIIATPSLGSAPTMASSSGITAGDSPPNPVGSENGNNNPSGHEDQNGMGSSTQVIPEEIVTNSQPDVPGVGDKIDTLLHNILAGSGINYNDFKAKQVENQQNQPMTSSDTIQNTLTFGGVEVPTGGFGFTAPILGGAQVPAVASKSCTPTFSGVQLPSLKVKQTPQWPKLHNPSVFELGALDAVKPAAGRVDTLPEGPRFNQNWPLVAKPLAPGAPLPGSVGPANPGRIAEDLVDEESTNLTQAPNIPPATTGLNPSSTTTTASTKSETPNELLPSAVLSMSHGALTPNQRALITMMLEEENSKLRQSKAVTPFDHKQKQPQGPGTQFPPTGSVTAPSAPPAPTGHNAPIFPSAPLALSALPAPPVPAARSAPKTSVLSTKAIKGKKWNKGMPLSKVGGGTTFNPFVNVKVDSFLQQPMQFKPAVSHDITMGEMSTPIKQSASQQSTPVQADTTMLDAPSHFAEFIVKSPASTTSTLALPVVGAVLPGYSTQTATPNNAFQNMPGNTITASAPLSAPMNGSNFPFPPTQPKPTTPSQITDVSFGQTQPQSIELSNKATAMLPSVNAQSGPPTTAIPAQVALAVPPRRVTNLSIGCGRRPQGPATRKAAAGISRVAPKKSAVQQPVFIAVNKKARQGDAPVITAAAAQTVISGMAPDAPVSAPSAVAPVITFTAETFTPTETAPPAVVAARTLTPSPSITPALPTTPTQPLTQTTASLASQDKSEAGIPPTAAAVQQISVAQPVQVTAATTVTSTPKNAFEGISGHIASFVPVQSNNVAIASAPAKSVTPAKITDLPFGPLQGNTAVITAPPVQTVTWTPAPVATSEPAVAPVITATASTARPTPAVLNPFAKVNPATLAYNPANPFAKHPPHPKPAASQDVTMEGISTPVKQPVSFVASPSLADTTMVDALSPTTQSVFSQNPPPTTSPFARPGVGVMASQKPIPKNVFGGMPGSSSASQSKNLTSPAKITDLPFGLIQGPVAKSLPAAAPLITATPVTASSIQTAPTKPSEFNLAQAVMAYQVPSATTPAVVSPASGTSNSLSVAVPPPLSARLTDIEVEVQKRIAKLLGTSQPATTADLSSNAFPQPSLAPGLDKNLFSGKGDAGTRGNGEGDKAEKNNHEGGAEKGFVKPKPKVTWSLPSTSEGPKARPRRSADTKPERKTSKTSFSLSGTTAKATAPASGSSPRATMPLKEAGKVPTPSSPGEPKLIKSTLLNIEQVPANGTPVIDNAKGKEKAKESVSFQEYMDKQRAKHAAEAVCQPNLSSRDAEKPSPTPLTSVPLAPPILLEAWETELEGLMKDGLISRDLVDKISTGDEWLHRGQDFVRTRPLTPREIEFREYQRINDMYKHSVAKADTRWLKEKKKAVYENFLATYSFEYKQWKSGQKVKQSQKLLPAAVGKPQQKHSPVQKAASSAVTKEPPVPTPRRKTQKRASVGSTQAGDSSSTDPSPATEVLVPTEPFWKPSTAEQRVIEVPQKPEILPRKVISDDLNIVYNGLRDRGYSVDAVNSAIEYARKGPKDWDIPTVEAAEAWIQAGMVVPKGPEDWMFGEKTVAKAPPARDYGLRGGPLLYEDFEEIWAEEAAEKAAKAKAEEAKRAAENRSRLQVVERPRRPVSFEYKRLPDIAPAPIHRPTNLLRHSVDYLDVQYSDLTDVERSQGKRAALPHLETLKIRAPREGRSMDHPKIVDEYIQTLREKYEKIRMSKTPDPVYSQSPGVKIMEDKSQGPYDHGFTKGLIRSAVTGAVSAAATAGVFAVVSGLYHRFLGGEGNIEGKLA
ncbi:hypothetical protein BZA77DRAFT_366791 [Pyronema omphalodes]|nr:hypothetical protein BZA77DRAFT_366791 [Pyronema omphalodes]